MTSAEFQEIVDRHSGLIGRVVKRWTSLPTGLTRADLQQAGLIGLWEAAVTHDPARSQFQTHATWKIRKWIRDLVLEERRRSRQEALGNHDQGEEAPSALERMEIADDLERLRRKRRRLSSRHKLILRMRYTNGMTFREISRVLHISRTSIACWHRQVIDQLRVKMGAHNA